MNLKHGYRQATWAAIYRARQGGVSSQSMDSEEILRFLVLKGRMPFQSSDSYHSGGPRPAAMSGEATDNGRDIEVRLVLRKGCAVHETLALIGRALQEYADQHLDADNDALGTALALARGDMLAAGYDPKTKAPTDVQRAIGLWLADHRDEHETLQDAIKGLEEFLRPLVTQARQDCAGLSDAAFLEANEIARLLDRLDYKTCSRWVTCTARCIKAGEALSFS